MPVHKFVEDPLYIGYVYNRLLRLRTREESRLFFKPFNVDAKDLTGEEVVALINKSPKMAERLLKTSA